MYACMYSNLNDWNFPIGRRFIYDKAWILVSIAFAILKDAQSYLIIHYFSELTIIKLLGLPAVI